VNRARGRAPSPVAGQPGAAVKDMASLWGGDLVPHAACDLRLSVQDGCLRFVREHYPNMLLRRDLILEVRVSELRALTRSGRIWPVAPKRKPRRVSVSSSPPCSSEMGAAGSSSSA